jgi:xylitol oxidase
MSPLTDHSAVASEAAGENWAHNYHYGARALLRPTTVDQVRELVAESPRIRALGSRHSFNALADSAGLLVNLEGIDAALEVDEAARTVTVGAGIRYGDLATALQHRGWALQNLASLPHISVTGAVATGTHGSGDRNGTLSSSVAALELVTASGDLLTVRRGDPHFDGHVVALGALGIVTRVTLDIEPTFEVRQDLYDDLPWDVLLAHFDEVTSSAYSVSVFTTWVGETLPTTWLKSRVDAAAPPAHMLGAARATVDRHILPGHSPENTTQQVGVPGPWNDRLAHFRVGFTPSSGDEMQSEYIVPRRNAVEALRAVRALGERISPLQFMSEIRTMAADDLWLSGAYGTDAVGIHFTWRPLPEEVGAVLPDIEAALLPLGARPHWGKVFRAGAAEIAPLYPRFDDFRALAGRLDPERKFGNAFLEHTVFG